MRNNTDKNFGRLDSMGLKDLARKGSRIPDTFANEPKKPSANESVKEPPFSLNIEGKTPREIDEMLKKHEELEDITLEEFINPDLENYQETAFEDNEIEKSKYRKTPKPFENIGKRFKRFIPNKHIQPDIVNTYIQTQHDDDAKLDPIIERMAEERDRGYEAERENERAAQEYYDSLNNKQKEYDENLRGWGKHFRSTGKFYETQNSFTADEAAKLAERQRITDRGESRKDNPDTEHGLDFNREHGNL